jgi:hypothetical protein
VLRLLPKEEHDGDLPALARTLSATAHLRPVGMRAPVIDGGQAQDELGAEKLEVLADRGYFGSEELAACETAGIEAYVPKPLMLRRWRIRVPQRLVRLWPRLVWPWWLASSRLASPLLASRPSWSKVSEVPMAYISIGWG